MAILIPFRNESEQLPRLLINLASTIPLSHEVVFIDDGSDDGSGTMIATFIREGKHGNWVLLDNSGIGKKAALTTGLNYTQRDVILTTDADCILPKNWTYFMGQAFHHKEAQLVAGPVMTVAQAGFFPKFQQIEWASILLMTQFFFSRGHPLMCSGANLAYRRSAFLAVDGYAGNDMHPSGDDEFLLKKIVQKYGVNSVIYLQSERLLVKTQPLRTWASFLQQRRRWASKWRLQGSIRQGLAAVLAFVVAIIEISTVVLLFGPLRSWFAFLVFWATKVWIERYVLGKVLSDYHVGHSLFSFIIASLVHPIYVILIGVGAISGKYSWKGRNNNYKF